ncbi:MAG: DUF2953 domain-containing protein [Ruminococcus sp.]|nr:DUF2953 domain-containing protein [Ruminococcus sp.]
MTYFGREIDPRNFGKKSSRDKKKKDKTEKKSEPKHEKNNEPEKASEKSISDDELMHGLSSEQEQELIDSAEEKQSAFEKRQTVVNEKKSNTKKEKQIKTKKQADNKSDGGLISKIKDLRGKYLKYKPYLPMTKKYVVVFLKTVKINVENIEIVVGREDAHEAAIYYGTVQGTLTSLLSLLSEFFTVKVTHCDVKCQFTENVIDGEGTVSVKVRPSAAIAAAVCFFVNYKIIKHRQDKSAANLKSEKIGARSA